MSVILRSAKNQNEYTKGFYNGREFEQKRIAAILSDYPDIPEQALTDILEGNPQNIRCLSAEALELIKSDQHYFGRRKALGDAAAYLEKFAAEWQRTPVLNVRRLVLELAEAIRGLG